MYRFGVTPKGARRAVSALVMSAVVGLGCVRAETVVFDAQSQLNSAAWAPQNGFTFTSGWGDNFGRDTRNAPYLNSNYASLVSARGPFDFDAVSVGGWPWDNFDIGTGYESLPLVFYGADGRLIALREVQVEVGNKYTVFAERISNVSVIQFGSIGFATNGGGIRLNSLTINSPVPEPSAAFLVLVGLTAAARMRRIVR